MSALLQEAEQYASEIRGFIGTPTEQLMSRQDQYVVALADEVERLRAQLAWFEKREPLVRQLAVGAPDKDTWNGLSTGAAELREWERENQRP